MPKTEISACRLRRPEPGGLEYPLRIASRVRSGRAGSRCWCRTVGIREGVTAKTTPQGWSANLDPNRNYCHFPLKPGVVLGLPPVPQGCTEGQERGPKDGRGAYDASDKIQIIFIHRYKYSHEPPSQIKEALV